MSEASKIIKDFPGKTVDQYLKATGSLPDEHILQMPSELLLLFSDPLMGPAIKKFTSDVQRELAAAEKELVRLRKDPDDVLSEHPGCVFCMEAGTPVGDGEVCPKCGDRLPTRRERHLEAELAAVLKAKEEAEQGSMSQKEVLTEVTTIFPGIEQKEEAILYFTVGRLLCSAVRDMLESEVFCGRPIRWREGTGWLEHRFEVIGPVAHIRQLRERYDHWVNVIQSTN
jgi:hypothetical protein